MLVCLLTSLSTSIVQGHLIDRGYKYYRIWSRSEHSSHLGRLAWSSPSPSLRSTLHSWSCLSNLGSVSRNHTFRKFNHAQILIDYTHVRSTHMHVAHKAPVCRIWDPRGSPTGNTHVFLNGGYTCSFGYPLAQQRRTGIQSKRYYLCCAEQSQDWQGVFFLYMHITFKPSSSPVHTLAQRGRSLGGGRLCLGNCPGKPPVAVVNVQG